MRRVCELALAALCLGCTDGGPEPASFELAELEPELEAHAGFEHQPERERVVDPNSQPRLELVPLDVDPEDGACPYEVEPRGFPAISDDGAILVDVYGFVPGNAEWTDAQMELSWLDAAGVRVEQVYDRGGEGLAIGDAPTCEESIARVRERVAELNAELARQTWRPLERLDALYSEPGFAVGYERYDDPELANLDQALTSLAGEDRPVEVFYRNGHFIARVRGLQVLQSSPRPEWRQLDDEFCSTAAQIEMAYFDRATRLALVHYNYSNGGCLCDDRHYPARIELSAELLAEAERRSTARFFEAHRERLAADSAE